MITLSSLSEFDIPQDSFADFVRFGQLNDEASCEYDKTEGNIDFSRYTHLLTGNATVEGFSQLSSQQGFDRLDLHALRRGESPFVMKEMVYIHQSNSWRNPQGAERISTTKKRAQKLEL